MLLLDDDFDYGDVRCLKPRHGKILTPSLDRLATQGMTFTGVQSPLSF